MIRYRNHRVLLILISCVLLLYCPIAAAQKNTIAVLDFTNQAGPGAPPGIERMANDVLAVLLAQTGKFRVLERTKVDALQREIEFNKSEWVNPKKAIKMGKMLGAEYIATGSITDLGAEVKSFSGYGVTTKNVAHSLSIELKIIDTKKGEIIFGDLTSDSLTLQQSPHLSQSLGEELYKKLLKNALAKSVNKLNASFSGKTPSAGVTSGQARVYIHSAPAGADIEINGTVMGKTPANLTIADGTHRLKISKPAYRPWEKQIQVADGLQIKANLIAEGFQK